MRRLALLVSLLLALPLFAQAPAVQYKIEFDPLRDVTLKDSNAAGTQGLFVNVRFSISVEGAAAIDPNTQYKILIEENGRKVHEDDVPRPTPTEDLAVMLALDTSGSMSEHGRMEKARSAAELFVNRLPAGADCGLILFDHEMRTQIDPSANRTKILGEIASVQPRGGTAFLDAAQRGIEMLGKSPSTKKRYLVLMTDGVDLNSSAKLADVIAAAQKNQVQILAIGIGEPGKNEHVNTVLVLDRSESMKERANPESKISKLDAMKLAAKRFVEIMPAHGWASILTFESKVDRPTEFTNDRNRLKASIGKIVPGNATALLAATMAGVKQLEAAPHNGRNAVVVMTDGIDSDVRQLPQRLAKAIAYAKTRNVPIYTLGFGSNDEVDLELLDELAIRTGGRSYHARNERSLLEIFENLSIQLHDDGIDETSLRELAQQTGGQYYPVKNVAELRLIFEKVSATIQHKQYEVTFPSLVQRRDGTNRLVNIKLVKRTGELVSNTASGLIGGGDQVLESTGSSYQTRGLVVAEMHPFIYLLLLGGIVGMLALPGLLKRSR